MTARTGSETSDRRPLLVGVATGYGVWRFMTASVKGRDRSQRIYDWRHYHGRRRKNLIGTVQKRTGNVIATVSESASHLSNNATRRVEHALGSFHRVVERHPLAMLAGGIIIGSLVRRLLPGRRPDRQ